MIMKFVSVTLMPLRCIRNKFEKRIVEYVFVLRPCLRCGLCKIVCVPDRRSASRGLVVKLYVSLTGDLLVGRAVYNCLVVSLPIFTSGYVIYVCMKETSQ